MRKEVIGPAMLYLADCRDVFPLIQGVDAVVTDPPYGIGADEAGHRAQGKSGWTDFGPAQWDKERPPQELFKAMLACSKEQIIWGGNYFTDFLPPSMQWLIWDKGQREFSLADFEMAWSSQKKAARIFTYARGAALQDGKEHPTQKPLALMKWCIDLLPNPTTVFDPFMGSGTTGVAAVQMGKTFIGVEREEKYFNIACRRIKEAVDAGTGFFAI